MPKLCKLVRISSSRCPKKKKPATPKKPDLKMKKSLKCKSFDVHFTDWVAEKKEMGVPESKLSLPFLVGAPKLGECRVCENVIYPGEEVSCYMNNCEVCYHSKCASDRFGALPSSNEIKCPQHECYHCKKKTSLWRCSRCDLASHEKCAAFPEYVLRSDHKRPWEIICWRHSTDSPSLIKRAVPTSSIEEVFGRLPLPYVETEFKIDPMADNLEPSNLQLSGPINTDVFHHMQLQLNVEEEFKIDLKWRKYIMPPPYTYIKRNIYRIKRKDDVNVSGCEDCGANICGEDCICRNLALSCTSSCDCSENCTNRPFQSEGKKLKVVMTEDRGWGVEAVEFIDKGDFVIEYTGEVIDDDVCEKRFWEMREQGLTSFYVVAIRKDFNIDAKFKGNESRFINHSCDPNCTFEKCDVKGETRLAIFAIKPIQPGEELTFDYGSEIYGAEVECLCGASNCHGKLGTKRKDLVAG